MNPQLIRLLIPILLRLFPVLPEIPVIGRIIVLFGIHPEPEEDLAAKLSRNFRRKQRPGFNDNSRVVKVEEAIRCVESVIGNGKLQALGMIRLARMLLDQSTGGSPIGDAIIDCIRNHALPQSSKRVASSKRRYHRPSRGHGHGR